jgi:hypothetical protein
MNNITLTCPHCHTKNVAFTYIGNNIIQKMDKYGNTIPKNASGFGIYNTFWICNKCSYAIVVIAYQKSTIRQIPIEDVDFFHDFFKIMKIHPYYTSTEAPEHTPEVLSKPFIEGKECCRQLMFTPSAMMMRKVLELALPKLIQQEGLPLKVALKKLEEMGTLPKIMAEWRQNMREIGNIAAHESEEITAKEAWDLVNFTELFLTYTFTLPGMIEERKKFIPSSEPVQP